MCQYKEQGVMILAYLFYVTCGWQTSADICPFFITGP